MFLGFCDFDKKMPRFAADKITCCRVVGAFPMTFQCLIADNMLDVCMFRLSFLTRVIADDRVQFLQIRAVNGSVSVQVGPGTLMFQGYVCMYVCMYVHPATRACVFIQRHVRIYAHCIMWNCYTSSDLVTIQL